MLSHNISMALQLRENMIHSSIHSIVNIMANLKKSGSKLKPHESFGQDRSHLASQYIRHRMEECAKNGYGDTSLKKSSGDHDESTDKILEIDTWKPPLNPKPSEKRFNNSRYSSQNDDAHGR